MKKIAFIFPGQGSQYVGMGKDFYETFPCAKEMIDLAEKVSGIPMKELLFEENENINITKYTQIAMLADELAIWSVLREKGFESVVNAGLSLGEYCAIAVAGGMCDLDAIKTVRSRGAFMEHAAPEGTGAMSAVLGLEASVIEEVLEAREGVSIANYNCPGQIVITGEAEAVAEAGNALKEAGARRVLPLKVSGPFHSPMMKPAGEELKKVFASVSMNPLLIPYVANINAEVITDCGRIEDLLVQQVSGSVRWQQSVETMIREGVDTFVEIGPGKTLTGFLRKIDKNVRSYHIGTWEEALSVCEELESGRR